MVSSRVVQELSAGAMDAQGSLALAQSAFRSLVDDLSPTQARAQRVKLRGPAPRDFQREKRELEQQRQDQLLNLGAAAERARAGRNAARWAGAHPVLVALDAHACKEQVKFVA